VMGEIKTTEAWARTYILRPAVNPAELSAVMILTPERAAAGLTNVWAGVGAVDSATRSIVLAGDSLARQAAAAEAAARRAALDSAARLLRDTLGRDTTGAGVIAPAPPVARPTPTARVPDSAAAARARARRDSIERERARADSIARQIPGAPPVIPPATPRPTVPGATR
jgi:hypothetical protein